MDGKRAKNVIRNEDCVKVNINHALTSSPRSSCMPMVFPDTPVVLEGPNNNFVSHLRMKIFLFLAQ